MTGPIARLAAGLRQRSHHPAFRVPADGWDPARQERLARLVAAAVPAEPASEFVLEPEPAPPTPLSHAELVAAATNLWAARRRLTRADGGAPDGGAPDPRTIGQVSRYLRHCADDLGASGLVVQDHDGDHYHPGLALEVLEWVEDATLHRDTVVRTVRPTIYLHGQSIRQGAVIVGHPGAAPREEDRP